MAGAAAQPRRLAVLALLARAGRAGVTREKILALLWPDEPEDKARRSLNQAVYSLRRDLGGEDALLGSKDLRLNLDLIEVDVIEFEDAIRAGDFDRAVGLYAGPFLEGFFLPRSSEFERWVEGERAALAHEFTSALERAANLSTQRGDHAAAVAYWRKLAAADPLNARVALSVMNALIAVGDTGGAIQHGRLHEVLLDQELGLPPDRDVAALARQLRARSEPARPEAPAGSAPVELAPGTAELPEAPAAWADAAPTPPAPPPNDPPADDRVTPPAVRHRTRIRPTALIGAAVLIGGLIALVRERPAGERVSKNPVVVSEVEMFVMMQSTRG